MNLNDVKDILKKVKIKPIYYVIDEPLRGDAETVHHIHRLKNGFEVYILDRVDKLDYKQFKNEDEACRYFISLFEFDYPQLKKYVK